MSTIRLLIRPAIFTAGVCGTCFCGAVVVNFENKKRLYPIQDWVAAQKLRSSFFSQKYSALRQKINTWKNQLTTGEKIAGGTIFINFLVLCSWRVNGLRPVMTSHSMPLHFAVNMYALYSFSNFATALLGPEQLVGLFLSAGAVSSFASIANRLLNKSAVPSLGASGALLGVIAYICIARPQSDLLLFFIPITAGTAIKTLMMIDFVGLVAKWRYIDHAAHLGGSLFGIWYALYGEKLFYKHRGTVIEKWLEIKSRFQQ